LIGEKNQTGSSDISPKIRPISRRANQAVEPTAMTLRVTSVMRRAEHVARQRQVAVAHGRRWVRMDTLIVTALVRYLPDVTNRDIAIDLIQRLPEDTPLQDIAKEIEFIAGVREGFEQIEQGEGVPAEEVRRMIPSWITR